MIRASVINHSIFTMGILFLSLNCSAIELNKEQLAAAQAVADKITDALPTQMTTPNVGCSNANPFVVTGNDDKLITSAINSAVRERRPSITIQFSPGVPLQGFPISVADALNRVQLAGGSVKEKKDTGDQAAGILLAWAGAQLGNLVTQAVNALLGAIVDEWVTNNYKGYNAILSYQHSQKTGNIYTKVTLSCK